MPNFSPLCFFCVSPFAPDLPPFMPSLRSLPDAARPNCGFPSLTQCAGTSSSLFSSFALLSSRFVCVCWFYLNAFFITDWVGSGFVFVGILFCLLLDINLSSVPAVFPSTTWPCYSLRIFASRLVLIPYLSSLWQFPICFPLLCSPPSPLLLFLSSLCLRVVSPVILPLALSLPLPFPEATHATTGAPTASSVAWLTSPSPLPPTTPLLRRRHSVLSSSPPDLCGLWHVPFSVLVALSFGTVLGPPPAVSQGPSFLAFSPLPTTSIFMFTLSRLSRLHHRKPQRKGSQLKDQHDRLIRLCH